jgi:hypothetical protein
MVVNGRDELWTHICLSTDPMLSSSRGQPLWVRCSFCRNDFVTHLPEAVVLLATTPNEQRVLRKDAVTGKWCNELVVFLPSFQAWVLPRISGAP